MKKLITVISMVLVFGFMFRPNKLKAGEPQDQGAQLSGKFFHTHIYGSTSTTTNFPINVVLAPPATSYSGGQSIIWQNCFTKFVVQLSTAATFSIYDGTTTGVAIMTISGNDLGTITAPQLGNTISLPEDHLGPLCLTPGTTTNLVISTGTTAGVSANMTINYEGYTTAGAGSISN